MERCRLEAFRPAFAQPLEMAVCSVELGAAQLGFFPQQFAGGVDVAGHEDAESELKALDDALVESFELCRAFCGELIAPLALLGCEFA